MSTPDLEPTLQHIERLHTRRETLRRAQEAAEDQVMHRIAVLFRAGDLTLDDVTALYTRLRMVSSVGFAKRWSQQLGSSIAALRGAKRNAPNGPTPGTWYGPRHPHYDDPVPRSGTPVVYVLYDEHLQPCYVGSTGNLRARLSAHRRDKTFSWWTAQACDSRRDAYDREHAALQTQMPYLNQVRTATRSTTTGAR